MGLFHVKVRLTGPTGHTEEIELLVDTGAALSVVPRTLTEKLELKSTRSQNVVIASGRREVWPIAEAQLALNPDSAVQPPNFQGQCGILEERRRPTLKSQVNFLLRQPVPIR